MYTIITLSEKIKQKLPDSDITLINFTKIKEPCSFKCNVCNTIQEYTQADKILDRGRRGLKNACKTCEDTAQLKPRLAAINKINTILLKTPHISLCEEIKRVRAPVKWNCSKCNHNFLRAPSDFLKCHRCPWCEGAAKKLTIEIIRERIKMVHGNEYSLLSEFYDYNKSVKIKVRHNECGFIFDTNVHTFLGGHGCPRCKRSLGEKRVREYLIKHGFVFQEQYQIKDLESKTSNLSFDFYLEENQRKIVIEYNGRQHYEPVETFGGTSRFNEQLKRDDRKKSYCIQNNIELIIIPYNDEKCIQTDLLAQRLRGQVLEH